DVVTRVHGMLEEVIARHQQRAGEIVRERDAAEAYRLRRREIFLRARDHGIDRVRAVEQAELMRDLELPAPRREYLGEIQRARFRIVAADETAVAHHRHEHDANAVARVEVADE